MSGAIYTARHWLLVYSGGSAGTCEHDEKLSYFVSGHRVSARGISHDSSRNRRGRRNRFKSLGSIRDYWKYIFLDIR